MRRRPLQLVVAAAVGLVLLAGLSTVAVRLDRSPAGAAPSTGSVAELDRRVQPPPAPLVAVPDERFRLGALDLEGVLALAGGTPDQRAAAAKGLALLGFRQAVGHAWSGGGSTYVLLVYRFESADGSVGLLRGLRAQPPGPLFEVAAVPDAVAYGGSLTEQHVSFARGPYVYELTLGTAAPDTGHAQLEALLAAQRDRALTLDP